MPKLHQATHLLDVPNEILVNIIGRIQYTPHLAAISLSCKALHGVVEPLLYRAYSLGGPWEAYQRSAAGLQRLFLNILQRPKLGEYVRILAVSEIQTSEDLDEDGSWDGNLKLEECTPVEQSLLRSAVHELGASVKADTWLSALEAGLSEVYFALLLTKLPNLEALSFEDSNEALPLLSAVIKLTKVNLGVYMKKLSSLTIHAPSEEDHGFSLDPYHQLLLLPSLREFNGRRVDEPDYLAEASTVSIGAFLFATISPS